MAIAKAEAGISPRPEIIPIRNIIPSEIAFRVGGVIEMGPAPQSLTNPSFKMEVPYRIVWSFGRIEGLNNTVFARQKDTVLMENMNTWVIDRDDGRNARFIADIVNMNLFNSAVLMREESVSFVQPAIYSESGERRIRWVTITRRGFRYFSLPEDEAVKQDKDVVVAGELAEDWAVGFAKDRAERIDRTKKMFWALKDTEIMRQKRRAKAALGE